MNIPVHVLLVVIFGGVFAFLVLPPLLGALAKWRRRRHVAYDDRRGSVNLFKSRDEQPPEG